MDRNRLVDHSLGRLNRGLLIFRLGLYAAVMVGLVDRLGQDSAIAIPLVAALALLPAFPRLPRKIEVGVATTLVLEFVLTIAAGAFLALQFLPLFSVVVACLLLTRRAALWVLGGAVVLQLVTIWMHVVDLLPPGAELADLVGETLLLGAVGIGFLDIGGVLRRYQTRLVAQAEEQLRLTEVIGAKDQLIDSIAHEIRTPVTAVLGLSSELSSGVFAHEETVEIATLVATESRRLAHLVDNLVYQSRSEIGTLASSGETVVLRDSLQAAWHLLGLDAGALQVDGDDNVTGDRRRLEHIFVNLFDNSARHGSLPVHVEIRNGNGEVAVRFIDEGAGITDGRQKLFGRYEVEGDGHRPNTIGLGLPVSRMLARHMAGDIKIDDEGAVVLVLPMAKTVATV